MAKKGIDFEITMTGCYECTSHRGGRYPLLRVKGIRKNVSRHVYEEMFGPIPEGHVIRHKCDNSICINPEHLETGTMKDNSEDMVTRNRSAKGSKCGKSVLTEKEVKIIKTMLTYSVPGKDIANVFNIGESTVVQIKKKETWRHVPWPVKRQQRKSRVL